MFKFSKRSISILETVDERLQLICNEAIKEIDFSVIDGLRDLKTQKKYFEAGKSKTMSSKHLKGLAVDIVPFPLDWNNIDSFIELSKVIKRIALDNHIKLVWGGDWKTFKDYPHYQLES
jgi:peptidoglycan L-alanyl-D-glutamate endopeptidase CwlK